MEKALISIIGAGNVAWHLGHQLSKRGYTIKQIYSRHIDNATQLAKSLNSEAIDSIENLKNNCDIYFICVSDAAIDEIVNKIRFEPRLIAHTAGSAALSILSKFENYGVFYPLQSFTKKAKLDFSKVPICIEANNERSMAQFLSLANNLSELVYKINSEQRLQCHLAAVFANNFSNHMIHIASQILEAKNIPFDILTPIISETAKKIQTINPADAQTGPAVRNDKKTIEAHLKLLSSPHLEKIYSFVSESIWELKQLK